ncbi:haloacid dehalogenase type II [Streptomonospora nanhaiensis]|uniref:haloacid dehalogenase type II n=1 Tax=Streptomonospora nanhaiensis TaxID=1323731 RepID=UPI001C997A40|nr:haloacid dehalogenase type II [Streptomonospora nanhaiensis]MBX9391347.1 haloacid dehalogenase type II [Streptomonospora nanhaiensis]
MTSPADIDVIVFDVLGTMVDEPGGIRRGLRAALPGCGDARLEELLEVWQRHVEERQREMLSGRRPYAPSTALDREAAERVAAEAGAADPGAPGALAAAAQRLDPWPDSVAALDRIAARFTVVGLSNAAPAALTRISAHAGLRWHQALSAADAAGYKPHPDVYGLAVATADRAPERLLMVAAHAWNLRAAQTAGMRTAYVERPVGDPPRAGDAFDLYAGSLAELATALGAD